MSGLHLSDIWNIRRPIQASRRTNRISLWDIPHYCLDVIGHLWAIHLRRRQGDRASQVSSLPILYGSRESGHAYKAKLALSVLGIADEYRAVDLRQPHDQRRPDFRDVSPYGEVPVLVDGGGTLAQSNAILIHVARQTRRLGGEGNLDEVTQWLFWEANRIGFSVPNLRHSLVFAKNTSEVVVEWLRARALKDLATLRSGASDEVVSLGRGAYSCGHCLLRLPLLVRSGAT